MTITSEFRHTVILIDLAGEKKVRREGQQEKGNIKKDKRKIKKKGTQKKKETQSNRHITLYRCLFKMSMDES